MKTLITTEHDAHRVEAYLDREMQLALDDPRHDPMPAVEVTAAISEMAAVASSDDPSLHHARARARAAINEIAAALRLVRGEITLDQDRKSTRLNSSHVKI